MKNLRYTLLALTAALVSPEKAAQIQDGIQWQG